MKTTFSQIAQDYISGRRLPPGSCRAVLQWFGVPSLYFPAEEERERALEAFAWLYQAVLHNGSIGSSAEAQKRCAAQFAGEFLREERDARRLLQEFLRSLNEPRPVIIGVEGLDGSGKTVQANRLCSALEEEGNRVCLIDFPQYTGFFGKEVGGLLSGTGGASALELDEKSMCLWYALDRWSTIGGIRLEEYDYVIFNRYTLSNAVYQCARRYGGFHREFADWVFALEHGQLRLPVPDLYLYLDAGTDRCGENVLKKGERDYTSGLDVYEASQDLLSRCHGIYRALAGEIPEVKILDCIGEDGNLKSVETIGGELLACLNESLPR